MPVTRRKNKDFSLVCSLSPLEQFVLQFLAVIYEPVSVSFLSSCLGRADLPFPGNRRPGREELQAVIDRLRELRLINEQNQCQPVLAEDLVRFSIENGLFNHFAVLIEKEAPVSYVYGKWTTRCWRAMRQFRIAVYSQDFDKLDEADLFLEQQCQKHLGGEPAAVTLAARGFDPDWFSTLPVSMQFFLLERIVRHSMEQPVHFQEIIFYLEDMADRLQEEELVPFHRMLAGYYIFQGNFSCLAELLAAYPRSFHGSGYAGTLAFLQGHMDRAMQLYEEDLVQLREFAGAESYFLGLPGLFHVLALLKAAEGTNFQAVRPALTFVLSRSRGRPEELSFLFLDAFVRTANQDMPDMLFMTGQLRQETRSLSILIGILALHWMGVEIPEEFCANLKKIEQRAAAHGFSWLAAEAAELLAAILPGNDQDAVLAGEEKAVPQHRSIVHIISPDYSWKKSLQELLTLTKRVGQREQTTRLAWLVRYQNDTLLLTPREQKKTTTGQWSRGRPIALSRLAEGKQPDYLTAQDQRICAGLRETGDSAARTVNYEFDPDVALPALIGHPLVFLDGPGLVPVEIVAGEPELLVEEQGESLFIHFAQDIGEGKVAVWQETPTRFRVMQINEDHRRVARITGRNGLRVPRAASEQVLSAIANIASFMTVHSAIDVGTQGQDVTVVEADPTIHIHIIPYGRGFRLEMFVQPFSGRGPYLKPGAGVATLMAEVDGHRLQTRRNLRLEEEKAREIEESCPILDLAIDLEQENEREWHLLDPEECLQVLLEIDEIRDRVILEWPEGEKLAVRRQAGINQLNLNIRTSQQDWFAISGRLQIDQDEVIELKALLDRVRETRSRFIPLGDGQFLALTQEFRNRLEELLLYGETGQGEQDEIHVHPLTVIALDELTQQARTETDEGWKKQLQAIQDVQELVPEVPSTLQAELRDYQTEGFMWMARLAHLGVGGCLADDMGLGKTLQALAVILYRAQGGPTLVVAPTSVCMNWEQEANRFAPTLNLHTLTGGNRAGTVESLGKFDLLITSYTLLQQEIDLLEQVNWQTVVLDEAQAIKNAATKRSKAAMRLQARFRLITTGTPIENHLGELWNLFRFINPGFLGTYKQFNARFGIPIEKHHDRRARLKLKKLIRPFMLRRIKSQVLDELPPRTEITLRVEMKPREMQFYEAIRQQALENIEGNLEQSGRHLQILAEIMRLRRACCNPRLIDPDSNIGSTKLQVFGEVVEELLGSRHKALVFSQFTGHLALIREYLDREGIVYKYLDGTTPTRERQRQVESFQAGEGDLFLISLKAGGLGLNLTAADYVIHMDPWWNPAVEDQAADRAHRIGQKRPVTVYRLVTANTIEEKIVRLHQEKRDLANSLLEGTDVSARISTEELLELIRGR